MSSLIENLLINDTDSDGSDSDYNFSSDESDSDGEYDSESEDTERRQNDNKPINTIWGQIRASKPLFRTRCSKIEIPNVKSETRSPIDFFKLMVTDEMIDDFVVQTNKHAEVLLQDSSVEDNRLKEWIPTDRYEMLKFFAILMGMEIVVLPELSLYWEKSPLYHNRFISSIMSCERFLQLLKCWYFADDSIDNTSDSLYMLRPLINRLRLNFKEHMIPGKSLVIGESTIPLKYRTDICYGRRNRAITIPKLCTSTGYTLNFILPVDKAYKANGRTLAESIVLDLLSEYCGKNHILYCDEGYTSYKLAEDLLSTKTRMCGPVVKSSKYLCPEVIKHSLKKGELVGRQSGYVKLIKWYDSPTVLMLTTCESHSDILYETGRKRRRSYKLKPNCVLDYNIARKTVDYREEMASFTYTGPLRRKGKWYRRVAVELIFGVAVVNSWILYDSIFPEYRMTITKFRQSIIRSLVTAAFNGTKHSKASAYVTEELLKT